MGNYDKNDENRRMKSTTGYQSTKLNKNREIRQKAQLKTDLTRMERSPETQRRQSDVQGSGAAQRNSSTQGTSAARRNSSMQRSSSARRNGSVPRTSPVQGTDAGWQEAAKRQRAMERRRKRRRQVFCMRICLLLFAVLILAGVVKLIHKAVSNNEDFEEDASIEEEIKSVLSDVKDDTVNVTKYYVYGTHLNLEGTISATEEIKTMELVLVDDKKGISEENAAVSAEDTAEDELEKIYVLSKTINEDGSYSFKTAENINEGINLENISDGNYCLLLKVVYATGTKEYHSLTDTSGEEAITYYTLTKNGKNQKIDISFEQDTEGTNLHYLQLLAAESGLPEDVYDIVIDAGHGGKDTGAVYGSYTESELTLQYAKALKESLENEGLKVLLTRDGSEPSDEDMAYTMYDENGRVSISCRSGAKYCLCLHLNSNAETLAKGGVQVYTSIRGNGDFAKLVADGIVENAGTYYSNMETGRLVEGVYQSPYSEQGISLNVATAEKHGYEPYNYSGVDALFMIRELGGIATGAFVDGRDTRYGSNEYRNSNTGVETLLIELGYINISEDLENILSNQKGYVKGMTDAVMQQITVLKTS